MRHILFWVVTVPVVTVLIIFTVMNTQDITLNFWPLPWDMPIPAYGLIFGCLLIGFLFGLFVMWRQGSSVRRHRRDLNRQLSVQAGELDSLRRQTVAAPGSAKSGTMALVKADPNALVPPAI